MIFSMTELERIRHSAAHVLATAILKIWPEAQFAAGPPVENGFYYDVELPHRISPEDFARLEEEMKKEVKANHPFERAEISRDDAIALAQKGRLAALTERPEPSKFKRDIVERIDRGAQVTAPGVVPALLQVQEVRGEESVVERAVCKAERRRGIEQADVCGPTAGEQRAAEFATPLAKRVVRLASARKRRLYEHVRVR